MKLNVSIAKAQAAKTLLATFIVTLWTAPVVRADQDSIFERRDDDLITERRDDDLIEPLDSPAANEPNVQQRTEEAFDRSEGRLKDQALELLDRMQRRLDGERLFETFEEWRERTDRRIEQQQTRMPRSKRKVYERESDRLAPERQEYLDAVGRTRDAASAGAVDDRRKLEALREAYEQDMEAIESADDRARRTEHYQRERAILLGVDPPTTAPTTAPTPFDSR